MSMDDRTQLYQEKTHLQMGMIVSQKLQGWKSPLQFIFPLMCTVGPVKIRRSWAENTRDQ